jgi:catechol 2,3-dioxygenase-like lactoylglutathione lyase family enzyme
MASSDPPQIHSQAHTAIDLLALDHVALSVADVGAIEAFLCDDLGMQVLERSGDSLLVGADARATGLRLTAAEGPREPGALARLVLRVSDPQRAVTSLRDVPDVREDAPDSVTFDGPEGLGLGFTLMAGGGIDYDIDHVILRVADPEDTRIALAEVGCLPRGQALHVADKRIELQELPAWTERPLLEHIALRVGSIEAVAAQARRRGLAIYEGPTEEDALVIVLPGPERIKVALLERAAAD